MIGVNTTGLNGLSWLGIVRLGLVQTALGAVVVLTTSTLNRVMAVELALPAMLPGVLVGLHYAVQLSRPRWGHGSDVGGRRTPWILGGVAVLAIGGLLAAVATAAMATTLFAGVALAVIAFVLIGLGVGACGTSLLALLAATVAPTRRAGAASLVWMMMIAGMALTAGIAGAFLEPFSLTRLVAVCAVVSGAAFGLTLLALWGVERGAPTRNTRTCEDAPSTNSADFRLVLAEVWADTPARRFTIFVFVSMLAYSGQDLILEPFAGFVFDYTARQSTQLAGLQHGGVLFGMIAVALSGSLARSFQAESSLSGLRLLGSLRGWAIGGCVGSALALTALAGAGFLGIRAALPGIVIALGFANGAFAVAAIGSMMELANEGRGNRQGLRMGLWGAAQAVAFGLGGFLGTAAADAMRALVGSPLLAYGSVFVVEAGLFALSAVLVAQVIVAPRTIFASEPDNVSSVRTLNDAAPSPLPNAPSVPAV